MAPVSTQKKLAKSLFLTIYLWSKDFVYLYCHKSVVSGSQWPDGEASLINGVFATVVLAIRMF